MRSLTNVSPVTRVVVGTDGKATLVGGGCSSELWDDLEVLTINYSPLLTTLPPLPPRLIELHLIRSGIGTLPPLPDTLEVLDVSENDYLVLTELPPRLRVFRCGARCVYAKFRGLPPLPNTLEVLECTWSGLKTLPNPLPPNLIRILLTGNLLKTLPPIPGTCQFLAIGHNHDLVIDWSMIPEHLWSSIGFSSRTQPRPD